MKVTGWLTEAVLDIRAAPEEGCWYGESFCWELDSAEPGLFDSGGVGEFDEDEFQRCIELDQTGDTGVDCNSLVLRVCSMARAANIEGNLALAITIYAKAGAGEAHTASLIYLTGSWETWRQRKPLLHRLERTLRPGCLSWSRLGRCCLDLRADEKEADRAFMRKNEDEKVKHDVGRWDVDRKNGERGNEEKRGEMKRNKEMI